MITFESSGSFKNTESFLYKLMRQDVMSVLDAYGQAGVQALIDNTPVDSGLAAASWDYEIYKTQSGYGITWTNSDIENGFPVAIMLQYGHGTGTGGYIQGQDYINPAMKPIFDRIAEKVWKAVTSA